MRRAQKNLRAKAPAMARSGKRGEGEFDIIARYFAPLATNPAALGLLDDAAVLSIPEGQELVATCDTIISGVHFLAEDPPDSIGYKALAVSLSDLAAKGARPYVYLLSVAFPERPSSDLARGLSLWPSPWPGRLGHRPCWWRYVGHAGPARHHRHRTWDVAARRGGVAPRRHGWRPALRERRHRRCRARIEALA